MKIIRLTAILAALLMLFASCSGKRKTGDPSATDAAAPTEYPFTEDPNVETTFRRSTLYYVTDDGYLVPVVKLVPWEEGIAKACFSYMTGTEVNSKAAGELGLKTVIPAGAELSITIMEGNALVDIRSLEPLPDAASELNMIEAIVNTLVGFSTVTSVTITRDGEGGALENGTELPVRRTAYPLNPESDELETIAGLSAATLYFPNTQGTITVPVTRYMQKEPSVYALVSALIEGTRSKGLRSCFPENTLLLGAAIEAGTVTVNLSDDFKTVEGTEGLFSLAVKTLWLTLAERYDLTGLRIQVNGVNYSPETADIPTGVNVF
ncbi:MAG: GerMN domain-containing protein [Clostridia bacterium]|nr:GerMN domain-containing protein [Clostridia bacterium]